MVGPSSPRTSVSRPEQQQKAGGSQADAGKPDFGQKRPEIKA